MKALSMANTMLVTKNRFRLFVVRKYPIYLAIYGFSSIFSFGKFLAFFSQQRGDNSISLPALCLPSKELSFDTQQAYILIILKMAKIALGDL